MSCFLCGKDEGHHLGCMVHANPGLTVATARASGLLPQPIIEPEPEPLLVEILPENSMTTVPSFSGCTVEGCDNPKYSDHARVKYCEEHRDPKSRKE